MKFSVCPHRKGVVHRVKWNQVSVIPTPKRGGSRLKWIEYFLWEFNQHRSCEINMKSSVFPTPKRGGFFGQSETASYLAVLGGIPLVSSYAGNIVQRLGDIQRLLINLGGSLISSSTSYNYYIEWYSKKIKLNNNLHRLSNSVKKSINVNSLPNGLNTKLWIKVWNETLGTPSISYV